MSNGGAWVPVPYRTMTKLYYSSYCLRTVLSTVKNTTFLNAFGCVALIHVPGLPLMVYRRIDRLRQGLKSAPLEAGS